MRRPHRIPAGAVLLGLQIAVAAAIYQDFITGRKVFAFADIGSDTYGQFVPLAMHLSRYLATEGLPGWSFQVGLGASLAMFTDPFLLLSTAFGPEAVPGMRIWIHLLKIACGGAFFLRGLLAMGIHRDAAIAPALLYSFCGYILVDGQWDPHASEFVFYSLILWAVAHQRVRGGSSFVPLAVAAAAVSGVFMFAVGFFLVCLFAADLAIASDRAGAARRWLTNLWPLALLGLLLGAVVVLPNTLVLLDSPRVGGSHTLFRQLVRDALSFNDAPTILAQLAGLWHKDLLGVGDGYGAWMNYLEGPGFYAGVLTWLLIPQLWRGDRADRIRLAAGVAAVACYIASPLLRFAAFGFGLYYFRTSTLWVTMLLLVLAARALEVVSQRGVGLRLLAGTALAALTMLGALLAWYGPAVRMEHVFTLLVLLAIAVSLLVLRERRVLFGTRFAAALLALAAADAVSIGWPTANQGRAAVSGGRSGYADDTPAAIRHVKSLDPGFYRVEKTYLSVSLCDSLVQEYFGTKSYWFHGSGIVRFFIGMGLLPPEGGVTNYTNWLPGIGNRLALYSLLGVRYVIGPFPLAWPGFDPIATRGRMTIYRNAYAMPLGIVQHSQYPLDRFERLPLAARDAVILNAAIVDRPLGGLPVFDDQAMNAYPGDRMRRFFFDTARGHQRTGLSIERFSQQRITGRVEGGSGGILVFSIPDVPGWQVRIDGGDARTFRANLGMLAVAVAPGAHRVELAYRQPGRDIGAIVSALALIALVIVRRTGSGPSSFTRGERT